MGTTRTDLRGFLQKTSSADERSSSSYLINSAPPGGSPSGKKEEVVKYMSKLPGYLQEEETRLLQTSSVLNLGVLDWSRLEKWKHGHRPRAKMSSSSTTTTSLGTVPNGRCKIDDDHHHVHTCSNLGIKVRASRDSSLTKQEMPTCTYHSSAGDHHDSVKSRRSLSSSALLSTMGNSGDGSLGAKETEKRAGEVLLHARERRKQCVDKFDGQEDSNAGLTCEEQQEQVSNIVLLRSTKQSRSCTLLSSEMPSSLDDKAKLVAREVNRSLDLERDSEDMMLPLLLGVDHSAKKEPSGTRTTSHSKPASRRILYQEKKKKTDPSSPSKRFSFSFGRRRLSRSFTFREDSSAGQPLTSSDDTIKSDSMRLDGSACPSLSTNPEEEKHYTRGGSSRVSPLRRLLDPLLKPKGFSENVLLPSRTRALLQLTIRDGIPLFQFVVDDDNLNKKSRRSILGATMKSSDASSLVKVDSVHYCTFYSVNEVKKKKISGSWLIHHGHKDKQQQQHRFVYNVIGEMRLCNSSSSSTEQKSEDISSVIRESVLVDETEEGVNGRKEVAAVVIKKQKKKPAEEDYGETATVIVPGGVHSRPEKGEPTPLIRRWRTGGCCDCGGWDVGCKLHLLSNKTFLHDLFAQTFKLFHQEESDKTNSGPVLAMTELKRGMYRVEFGSFLSHLQAFFVCVTVITCASEEETVSKTTGKSSSPFVPPLSPVGRA